jgi:hypothetical protein
MAVKRHNVIITKRANIAVGSQGIGSRIPHGDEGIALHSCEWERYSSLENPG